MNKQKRRIPEAMKDQNRWAMNRRSFLKKTGWAVALVSLPYGGYRLGSYMAGDESVEPRPFTLTTEQMKRLENVQDILFPSEPDAPGARDVNAAAYLQAVLWDEHMDPEERTFLVNGLEWLEEEAHERWEKSFNVMLNMERTALLEHIESHDWGSAWLSSLLLFIFEALLSDPIYGGNSDEKGWKWLGYIPGQPRPQKKYDAFLQGMGN